MVAGIFSEELSAVAYGGGLYSGGTLQHWYFSAVGIFSSQNNFFGIFEGFFGKQIGIAIGSYHFRVK